MGGRTELGGSLLDPLVQQQHGETGGVSTAVLHGWGPLQLNLS